VEKWPDGLSHPDLKNKKIKNGQYGTFGIKIGQITKI
jgi:hypothetical protein